MPLLADTTIQLIVRDPIVALPDTATVRIDVDESSLQSFSPSFKVVRPEKPDAFGGLIGGYEVLISNYDQLSLMDDKIYEAIPFNMQVEKITDRSPEIFAWLEMLDINVIIIIVLMVVISIINMTSALLIIILERQNLIGTLKAFGMGNAPLMRIFLINAAAIIGKGMLWGNLIGIGLGALQHYFHFIPLDPANYYVNTVPIYLDWSGFLMLDLITMGICVVTLTAPAFYVAGITPIKSIRFS
jgi:lipoprotein-releasing system permease protein